MKKRSYDIPNDPRFSLGGSIYSGSDPADNINGEVLRGGYVDPHKTMLVVVWRSRRPGDASEEHAFLFSTKNWEIEERGQAIFLTRKGPEAPGSFDPPPAAAQDFFINLNHS